MSRTTHALVLEDDRSWQQILAEILNDVGLAVDIYSNLEEAESRLHEKAYRFAVVDLSLGEHDHLNQDGICALQDIRRLQPGCVAVLLTGFANVELAVSAIQDYGAYTCLRKENFRRADFRDLVLEALSMAQVQAPAPALVHAESVDSPASTAEREASLSEARHKSALLVEDDAGWRNLLIELLQECHYEVQASSSYGEASGWLKRLDFDLAVADLSLASSLEPEKNLDGYRLLASTRAAAIPTIVVSGVADATLIDQAYAEHNIFACLEKRSFNRVTFLETVHNAEVSLWEDPVLASLTERERQVLRLLAQGMTNKEIAADLFISTNTVKRHLKSIFEKLNVTTRAAASAWASRMGFNAD
jgi:DNA-binding NarL/FixJ family response regulator